MRARQGDPDPEDEQRQLAEAMADVRPLPKDHRIRHRPAVPPVVTPKAEPYRPPPARSRDDEPDETEGDSGYVANGVDRRELRKLRKGQYAVGRRLDLHGFTSRNAVAATLRFIEAAHHGFRCVAIVHGRGNHSAGRAVLKEDVRALLRSHRTVLAYTDAPRDDGGSGAVYVLLRKRA